jgi:Na+-transporting NADH:ubiquinone oxidoreductase subunit NqrC
MKKGVVITIIVIFAVIIISVVAYLIYKSSQKKNLADAQSQLLLLQAQLASPATTIPEKANIITQIAELAALLQSSGVNLNLNPNSNTNTNTTSPAVQPPGFPIKKATGFNILAQNLQKGLNSKCNSKLATDKNGNPDGKFGSLTEAALMKCYGVKEADFALYNLIIS